MVFTFFNWLISLSIMFSRSIHTVTKGKFFLFFYAQVVFQVLMSHSCFIYSFIDGHLGCFHILGIVNNAAMIIAVLRFFQISVFGSFGYIPRSGITGSKGRSIFNCLRYLQMSSTVTEQICIPTNSANLSPHPR